MATAMHAGPNFMFPDRRERVLLAYLEDYFRLLTLLTRTPTEQQLAPWSIDPDAVLESWQSSIQELVGMPHFPGGMAVSHNAAYLDLTRFTYEDVKAAEGLSALPPSMTSRKPGPLLSILMAEDYET
jgi:hypothetical protein